MPRWRLSLIAAASACLPAASFAGLSLDELVARNAALAGAGDGRYALTPSSLTPSVPDGITFAAGGPGNRVPPLLRPEARGDGGVQVRLHTALAGGAVEARLGAAWWPGDDHPSTLDESSLSVAAGGGRFYASVERRHWGPAWTHSLILDGGARPIPAVGWRKDEATPFDLPVLRWLGPWTADFLAGRLDQRSGPSHPYFLAGRIQLMPLRGLDIGLSRSIQWGGSGRPEGWASLRDAILGNDNVAPESVAEEPGNQLAGYDLRYTLGLGAGRSVAVYGQAIGEDRNGLWPARLLWSVGADTAFDFGPAALRVFLEAADTSSSGAFDRPLLGLAYRHHIYTDGYTQKGDPIGHPIGGDARLASLGVVADGGRWQGTAMLHRGLTYPTSTLYGVGGHLTGADAELAWRIDATSRVGAALFWWSDPQGSRTRGQLWWQLAFP